MPRRMIRYRYTNRLKEVRLQALISSQAELARLSSICRTTICALESNRINLSIGYALRLKKVLKCSLDDLYEEIPDEQAGCEKANVRRR
jgi:DNA-binding XRE family transcriptional regulator